MTQTIQTTGVVSPFDAIRHETADGEYWSARELHTLMGYQRWEDFDGVVKRAIRSAENTETYSHQAFSEVTEKGTGGRPRTDYHLSRYAAYLVAMNGDPNKVEVAQAQAYFATRTREAETATAQPLSDLEIARRHLAAVEAKIAAEKELAVARPKASKWDRFCNSDGLIGMTEVADILKIHVNQLTRWLTEVQLFRAQMSHGSNRNLPRKPYCDAGFFKVRVETNHRGRSYAVAYATPKGVDLIIETRDKRLSPA